MEKRQTKGSVGIFGGTFDPIHIGHLILAERAREELELEFIYMMPARIPPHKIKGRNIAAAEERLEMLRLAVEDNPGLKALDIELEREGVSYTVDSLEEIHRSLPEMRLVFLMGSDNARDFSSWRSPERILELADIAVWERPGSYHWPEVYPGYIAPRISSPLIEISSTEIRNRIGVGESVRYMTPDSVIDYIERHGLYR